jgi:hypothetical protein
MGKKEPMMKTRIRKSIDGTASQPTHGPKATALNSTVKRFVQKKTACLVAN